MRQRSTRRARRRRCVELGGHGSLSAAHGHPTRGRPSGRPRSRGRDQSRLVDGHGRHAPGFPRDRTDRSARLGRDPPRDRPKNITKSGAVGGPGSASPNAKHAGDDGRMATSDGPYYRADLALVHHLGFGRHADVCAPGILALLEPIRARDGLVVELGCGSGLLTRYLVDAGHRVIVTDASPAMVDLARCPRARRRSRRAADPARRSRSRPPMRSSRSATSSATWATSRRSTAPSSRWRTRCAPTACSPSMSATSSGVWRDGTPHPPRAVAEDWAIITEFDVPAPDRFVRQLAIFNRNDDGT